MANITLKINGKDYSYEQGTSYEKIADDFQAENDGLIALVVENGKLKELSKKAVKDAEISFVTRRDEAGRKTYQRTVIVKMIIRTEVVS